MRQGLLLSLSLLLLCSCGVVRKKTSYGSGHQVHVAASDADPTEAGTSLSEASSEGDAVAPGGTAGSSPVDAIVQTALEYSGTRYRFGGTSRKGMDCSGLLYVAFQEHDFELPRVSHQMADQGRQIRVSNLQKGDLLFFKTSKRGKRINHVGLVVEVRGRDVRFIHSTTSRGVIVSSLREGFWNYAFVKATRVF